MACTFELLHAAHILSVQSKLSLYDYYLSIEYLTDTSRTMGFKVCFPHSCLCMIVNFDRIDTRNF